MKAEIFIFIGAGCSAIAGIVQLLGSHPKLKKAANFLFLIGVFMAFGSSALSYLGAIKQKSDSDAENEKQQSELKKAYTSAIFIRDSVYAVSIRRSDSLRNVFERKIDMQYANSNNDIKESFGIISRRTYEEYIAEKTPSNLSDNETKKIIKNAINKWFNDSVIKNYKTLDTNNKIVPKRDSSGSWKFDCCPWLFKWNLKADTQNVSMYYDAYYFNDGGPDFSVYIHVIIDGSGMVNNTFLTSKMDERSRNLYYKYEKWFEEMIGSPDSHASWHHLFIIVFDQKDAETNPETLNSELQVWLRNSPNKRQLKWEPPIIVYDRNDLINIDEIFN